MLGIPKRLLTEANEVGQVIQRPEDVADMDEDEENINEVWQMK
jgi:hypothetical protein